ncbi:MAG: DUF924 domain-containing protein [Caulobacteraceae bacterium]|nr:DUF924 domain-containing protein [Caulobacteraceae bacterium]
MTSAPTPGKIVGFWRDAGEKAWFRRSAKFDESVRIRFEVVHLEASRGNFASWGGSAEGALALVLLFDQFPRHIYRGSAHAFATDGLARSAADRAITDGFDLAFETDLQPFFYLPFEHHEDAGSQARSVELSTQHAERSGRTDYLRYARLHADLIARFGRFPHRNKVLGRVSTAEEIEYLASGGFKG